MTIESPTGRTSAWGAIRRPLFAVIWSATLVSTLGGWISAAAAGWLITALDTDPFVVSLVQVASNLPLFLLALPAGALTDIVDRRKLLIWSEVAIMAFSVALAVLVSSRLITSLSLLVMTFLISAAVAMGAPAWQAVVTELVPRKDLASAVLLNGLGINVSGAIGPVVGGILTSVLGYGPPFWIDAFSNAGVIGALLWWKTTPKRDAVLPPETLGRAMTLGLRHARYNPHLFATLVRTAAFFVFASAYWALLPLVARAQPPGGSILYGSLLGAIGVGAIAGAAFLPRVKKRWGADRFVAGCTVGTALATLAFALSRNSGTSLAASVLAGISWIGAVSAVTLSAQVALPDWVRGRGLSIQVAVLFGALSLGGLLWGKVAALTSTSISLLLAALAGLLLIPLTWRWKLQTGEAVDFTPSLHWPAPVTLRDVDGDRGPVLVTIEYRVDAESRRRFLGALFRLSRERIRDGAYSWRLFEDPAINGRFVEAFLTESWQEHLRHHSRITKSDQLYEEALALCTEGAPAVITHLIQVHKAE